MLPGVWYRQPMGKYFLMVQTLSLIDSSSLSGVLKFRYLITTHVITHTIIVSGNDQQEFYMISLLKLIKPNRLSLRLRKYLFLVWNCSENDYINFVTIWDGYYVQLWAKYKGYRPGVIKNIVDVLTLFCSHLHTWGHAVQYNPLHGPYVEKSKTNLLHWHFEDNLEYS